MKFDMETGTGSGNRATLPYLTLPDKFQSFSFDLTAAALIHGKISRVP